MFTIKCSICNKKCFSYNIRYNVYSMCMYVVSHWCYSTISGQTIHNHHFHSKLIKLGLISWLLCQSSKTCMLALACLLLNLFTTIIMCSGCGQTKIIKFTTAMLLSYWSASTKWQPLLAASLLWPISGL